MAIPALAALLGAGRGALGGAAAGAASGGATKQIIGKVQVGVQTQGTAGLGGLIKRIVDFRINMIQLGVATIFVDRLVQSLSRAWAAFNDALGVSKVSKEAVEMERMAELLGVSATKFELLASAASDYGMDARKVTDTIQILNEKLTDLSNGSVEMTRNFDAFGLSYSDFAGKDNIDKMLVFSDAFAKADRATRLGAFSKIFGGEAAASLGKFFETGSKGVIDGMREAVEAGNYFTDSQRKDAKRFEVASGRFQRAMSGLTKQVASIFIPAMADSTEALRSFVIELTRFIRSNLQTFVDNVSFAFQKLRNRLQRLKEYIDDEIMPSSEFFLRTLRAIAAASLFLGAVLLGKVVVGMAALGSAMFLIGAIIEDLYSFFTGGPSLFGTIMGESSGFKDAIITIMDAGKLLILTFQQIWLLIKDIFGSTTGAILLATFAQLLKVISAFALGFVVILRGIFSVIDALVSLIVGVIGIISGFFKDISGGGPNFLSAGSNTADAFSALMDRGARRMGHLFGGNFLSESNMLPMAQFLGPTIGNNALGENVRGTTVNNNNVTMTINSPNPVTSIPGAINTGLSSLPGGK